MSRPSVDDVMHETLTWQHAMYELHREIEKLDQENDIMRKQLGIPDSDVDPDSLETIEIEIRRMASAGEPLIDLNKKR